MPKPVRLRRLAAEDIDAVQRAMTHVGRHPHSGSLRFSYDLDIPELRTWAVGRFPYLIFYVDSQRHIDVWRVLHTRRDLAAALADNDED